MSNPYGITQVDIPAALNAFMTGQDRRAAQIKLQREEEKARREQEATDKRNAAYAKFFAPKGGGPASGGVAGAYSASQPSLTATPEQEAETSAMEARFPNAPAMADDKPYDPFMDPQARQELMSSIATIDPEQAFGLQEKFSQMDDKQREAIAKNNTELAKFLFSVRQIPPADRPAYVQQSLPMLRTMGLDDEVLANPDYSDRALETYISQGRDIEKIIESVTPTVMPVSGVGLFPVTPGSPYPNFTEQGTRPAAQVNLPRPQSAAERDALPDGAEYIAPDGSIKQKGGGGGAPAGSFPGWF